MSESVIQLARSNPRNEQNAHLLFKDYESSTKHDPDYDLTYLQLKWLYSSEKWKYLNGIAKLYINAGKIKNAYMCLIASLDANHIQPEIFALAESLKELSAPKMPDGLKNDTLAVSVIMPTYNRGAEIKESIQSVLNQSFRDFELVIVNDGGMDGVKDIVNSFCSEKIKYYKLERNKGLAGALNEGILKAEGKYIAYLDDDDIYYPEHLETLVGFMEERPDCDLIYSNAWWCSGEIKGDVYVEKSRKLLGRRPARFDRDFLFWINYISTLNVMHRKECFRRSGLFNEDLKMLMDWELWLRFALEHNFNQLNVVTGEYRFKGNNMSTVDELTITFLAKVIRRYYEVNCGNIVFLKHYLRNNQREKAEKIYYDLLLHYASCTRAAKKELFYISKEFPYWKSRKLFANLAVDFVYYKVKRLFSLLFKKKIRKDDLYC
jgi:glycosyltransferase involved in cell wall biosynthesis